MNFSEDADRWKHQNPSNPNDPNIFSDSNTPSDFGDVSSREGILADFSVAADEDLNVASQFRTAEPDPGESGLSAGSIHDQKAKKFAQSASSTVNFMQRVVQLATANIIILAACIVSIVLIIGGILWYKQSQPEQETISVAPSLITTPASVTIDYVDFNPCNAFQILENSGFTNYTLVTPAHRRKIRRDDVVPGYFNKECVYLSSNDGFVILSKLWPRHGAFNLHQVKHYVQRKNARHIAQFKNSDVSSDFNDVVIGGHQGFTWDITLSDNTLFCGLIDDTGLKIAYYHQQYKGIPLGQSLDCTRVVTIANHIN